MASVQSSGAEKMRRVRVLAAMSTLGVAYPGLTTLTLHFQPTGYDPVRNVVSDYSVGQFGDEMALAFFVGGIDVITLSLSVLTTSSRRISKAGSYLLAAAGIAFFTLGRFQQI